MFRGDQSKHLWPMCGDTLDICIYNMDHVIIFIYRQGTWNIRRWDDPFMFIWQIEIILKTWPGLLLQVIWKTPRETKESRNYLKSAWWGPEYVNLPKEVVVHVDNWEALEKSLGSTLNSSLERGFSMRMVRGAIAGEELLLTMKRETDFSWDWGEGWKSEQYLWVWMHLYSSLWEVMILQMVAEGMPCLC